MMQAGAGEVRLLEGPWAKVCGQALGTGKGKGRILLLRFQRRHSPSDI